VIDPRSPVPMRYRGSLFPRGLRLSRPLKLYDLSAVSDGPMREVSFLRLTARFTGESLVLFRQGAFDVDQLAGITHHHSPQIPQVAGAEIY
jgi:hypothetical protein